jgi:uncharacterized protein DUF6894
MARYFFDFVDGSSSAPDLVGRELPNPTAARAEAVKVAADLATIHAVEGRPPTYSWIEVCDDQHRPVARLPVTDVIREPNRLR